MIRHKLSIAIGSLCMMSILSIFLLIYMIERTHHIQDRLEMQYQTLVAFMKFEAHVNESFMLAEQSFFNLDTDSHFDPGRTRREVELQLLELDSRITAVADFLGWSEAKERSEKLILAKLDREITSSFEELELANDAYSEQRFSEADQIARYVFDVRINNMFTEMVGSKITTEEDRIERAQRDIRSVSNLTSSITVVVSVVVVGVTLWAIFTLFWQVQHGLDVLGRGAGRLAEGDLGHRIDLDQKDELGDLATLFNVMAAKIQKSQEALGHARQEMENKVEQRTLELNEANQELEQRDERRRQFFADVGHELRTPVTAIRGQAEVALRSRENHLEQRSEALQKIVSLTNQLTQDVSALFFIAREQAGVVDLRQEPVDLGEVVAQVMTNMSGYFAREQASVHFKKPVDSEYIIEGTESRLKQLISILLTNAITHSHTGVEIYVAVTGTKSRVQLIVSDNGPGIPFSERLRVFERFYRMAHHTDSGVTGTGLGLPIARSLTLAHGGMIRADDSRYGGTEIHASFPRMSEDYA